MIDVCNKSRKRFLYVWNTIKVRSEISTFLPVHSATSPWTFSWRSRSTICLASHPGSRRLSHKLFGLTLEIFEVICNAHSTLRLTCFMSELEEVLSDEICLLRSCGLGVDPIQGESNITFRDSVRKYFNDWYRICYREYQILQWPESTSPADLGSCLNTSVVSWDTQ